MNDSENIAPVPTPVSAQALARPLAQKSALSLANASAPIAKRSVSNASSSKTPSAVPKKRRALGDITNRARGAKDEQSAPPAGGSVLTIPTKPGKATKPPVTRRKPPLPRAVPRHSDGSVVTPEQTPLPIPRSAVFEPPVFDLGIDSGVPEACMDVLKRRTSHMPSFLATACSPPREASPFSFELDDRIIDTDIPMELDELLGPEDDLLL